MNQQRPDKKATTGRDSTQSGYQVAHRQPAQPVRGRSGWLMRQLQQLRRRDIILLIGFLSLACTGMIMVVLWTLQVQPVPAVATPELISTPGPQPVHTVSHVQVTGLSQYPLARAAAQAWAADAKPVLASANWSRVVEMDQIGEPTPWRYRFYSASKARLFFVIVEPDDQIRTIEHVVEVTLPHRTLATDDWLIDSPAALAIWLDHGGSELFRSNPGLELVIQLRSVSNSPSPVWLVVGLDERDGSVHKVVIDANSGTVLTITPEG